MRQERVGHIVVLVWHDRAQEAQPEAVVAVVVEVHLEPVVIVVVVVSRGRTTRFFLGVLLVALLGGALLFLEAFLEDLPEALLI